MPSGQGRQARLPFLARRARDQAGQARCVFPVGGGRGAYKHIRSQAIS